jgi:hypothetical protein
MALNAVSVDLRPSNWWRRVFVWLGCTVLLAVGLRFYGTAVLTYGHFDAAHYATFWKARWWLVGHLAGGSLALLLGPFQFSTWLRTRYVKVHRWMGRLYLIGVLVGSVSAVYMALRVTELKAFGAALLFLMVAWMVTSGMAYISALRRQFGTHKEWAIRSYVVTFAFVVFRLMTDLNVYGSMGGQTQLVMLVWIAWAVPLLLTEMVLQWRRSVGPAR